MKPIILLAVMGIAVTGLGAGFLGNTITLDVQSLGVGETDLVSQIADATIKFNVDAFRGNQGFIKNVITDCIVISPEIIVEDSTVWCKLTDKNGNVAAEGFRTLDHDLSAHTPTVIEIDDPSKLNSLVTDVHDVILVVRGPSVTQGNGIPNNIP